MDVRWRQLKALTWKNYRAQRKKPATLCCQIFGPTLFSALVLLLHSSTKWIVVPDSESWMQDPISICTNFGDRQTIYCVGKNKRLLMYYSPDVQVAKTLMTHINDGLANRLTLVGLDSESEIIQDIEAACVDVFCNIIGGVVFTNLPPDGKTLPKDIKYKVRIRLYSYGELSSMQTVLPYMKFQNPRKYEAGDYFDYSFLFIQHRINMGIINILKPSVNTSKFNVLTQRFPYPGYTRVLNEVHKYSEVAVSRAILLTLVLCMCLLTKDVTFEKESRMKVYLNLYGVSTWLQWASWYIYYVVTTLVTVVIMTVLLRVPIMVDHLTENGLKSEAPGYQAAIGIVEPSLLFALFCTYLLAAISFCFLVSAFFSASSTATCMVVVMSCLCCTWALVFCDDVPQPSTAMLFACLNFQTAFLYAMYIMDECNTVGIAAGWSNVREHVTFAEDFTMLCMMLLLFLDAFLYMVIALYIDAIFPSKYGIPKPWYFPLKRISRLCKSGAANEYEKRRNSTQERNYLFEDPPKTLKAGIVITNLRKVFGSGVKQIVALDDVTMTLYEGQITVLLGPNGAGKTVLAHVLSGYLPPTSGTAVIDGHDITTDRQGANSTIGFCPQNNTLFRDLTVEEHIMLFAKLRGCNVPSISAHVESLMSDFMLTSYKYDNVSTLSSGIKRRLSVLLALIGDSKVIILDDPSRCFDPDSRHLLWDLLVKYRSGRTMLLITQYLDEADYLGDRIAFLANGNLRFFASPKFLKMAGTQYTLVVKTRPSCDQTDITGLLLDHMNDVLLENVCGFELSYALQAENTDKFPQMLQALESNRDQLHIETFVFSTTSLNSVYNRFAREAETWLFGRKGWPRLPTRQACPLTDLLDVPKPATLDHRRALLCKCWALFVKRGLYIVRCPTTTILQIIMPFIITMSAFGVLWLQRQQVFPPINLSELSRYGKSIVVYSAGVSPDNVSVALSSEYTGQITCPLVTNVNATGRNINTFLEEVMEDDAYTYTYRYMVAAQFDHDSNTDEIKAVALYNYDAYHTSAISVSFVDNALLRYFVGAEYSIKTQNDPIVPIYSTVVAKRERIKNELRSKNEGRYSNAKTYLIVLTPAITLVTNFFAIYLITEREMGSKRLQLITGVHPVTFWFTTFVCDFLVWLLPVALIYCSFFVTGTLSLTDGINLPYSLVLFLMFGFAILPEIYLASLWISNGGVGLSVLCLYTLTTGAMGNVVDTYLLTNQDLEEIYARFILGLFLLLPSFALTRGTFTYSRNYWVRQLCDTDVVLTACALGRVDQCCRGTCQLTERCLVYTKNPLSFEPSGIGQNLIGLAIHGLTGFSLLVLVDCGVFHDIAHKLACIGRLYTNRDIISLNRDVVKEKDAIRLYEVSKTYSKSCSRKNVAAVDRLKFGVSECECFGLLGVNGCGKTTVFDILTGELRVTSGKAFVDGYEVTSDKRQTYTRIGYCGPFDSNLDYLTYCETLWLYGRLYGLYPKDISDEVNRLGRFLGMEYNFDEKIEPLSEGTRQKLRLAIALIGHKSMLILDGPTTCMDPMAKRKAWTLLSSCRNNKQTIMMSTNGMHEAEILCTRIGIMQKGHLVQFGTIPYLRECVGRPYSIKVMLRDAQHSKTTALVDMIQSMFPSCVFCYHQGALLAFNIPSGGFNLEKVFDMFGKLKKDFLVDEFLVGPVSLMDIFEIVANIGDIVLSSSQSSCSALDISQ